MTKNVFEELESLINNTLINSLEPMSLPQNENSIIKVLWQ